MKRNYLADFSRSMYLLSNTLKMFPDKIEKLLKRIHLRLQTTLNKSLEMTEELSKYAHLVDFSQCTYLETLFFSNTSGQSITVLLYT